MGGYLFVAEYFLCAVIYLLLLLNTELPEAAVLGQQLGPLSPQVLVAGGGAIIIPHLLQLEKPEVEKSRARRAEHSLDAGDRTACECSPSIQDSLGGQPAGCLWGRNEAW